MVPGAPTSRKHSLSLPPTGARPAHNGGLGGGLGEVDMSAYKSMAASLQAQTEAHQVRTAVLYLRPRVGYDKQFGRHSMQSVIPLNNIM